MAFPYLGYSHLHILGLYVPLLALILIYKVVLWFDVLHLRRATLSSIPGPKWAAWTRFWMVKTLASGDSAEIFVQVNERYGKIPSTINSPYLLVQVLWLV